MTPHALPAPHSLLVSKLGSPHRLSLLALVAASITVLSAAIPAHAQSPQQQYVYSSIPTLSTTSEVAAFSKDSTTGNLVPLQSSPTSDNLEGGVMAVDALGRFLFILNRTSSKISVFHIDPATGALLEVPASPFSAASGGPNSPQPTFPSCLAVEPTGQFLYVGYDVASDPGRGAIQTFQIDSANLQLLPLPTQFTTDLNSSPIGLISGLKGRFLYAGLGLNLSTFVPDGETIVFQIDPVTGQLQQNGYAGSAQSRGRSIAVDPQSRFFFEAWGASSNQGFIDVAPISPADGTASTSVSTLNLPPGELPTAVLAESSGKFLYVQQTSGVATYSINQATGVLTQSQPTTRAFAFQNGHAAADPIGPYLYSLANDGIHAFQIDPQAGDLSPLPGSPFPTGGSGQQGIAISGTPSSVQAVSGPAASLFPSSEDFGSITAGRPSSTRIVTLTNTGDQLLLLTRISIGGLDAVVFSQTNTCLASLKSGDTCGISITFTPTAPSAYQATLLVADNAPSASQSISLTGTGVAQQPDVTLAPASLSFPSTNQGSTSQPQSLTVTNDGTAPLQITSIAIDSASANASDFTLATSANPCPATLPVKSTCVVTATFSPLGNGPRSATIYIVDNAPGSPHRIPLTGTGTGAPVTHPGISVAPNSISFPATTQNATSAPQTLTITSSGTGTLHLNAPISLSGNNAADFALTNNCAAPAYVPGASCTVSLTFTPLGVGPRSASLVVTDDAPNSPQTIPIGGLANVVDQPISAPSIINVVGATPQSIKAGATATWNLALTPNFGGNLTFTCAGAPTAATTNCSSPSTMKVTSGTPAMVQVKITTAGPVAALLIANPTNAGRPFLPIQEPLRPLLPAPVWPTFIFAVFVLSLAFPLTIRRLQTTAGEESMKAKAGEYAAPAFAIRFATAAFTVLIAAVLSISLGCGGGSITAQSVPTTQPATTPQGTYTITVALTATPTNSTTTNNIPPILLTLVVQ